MSSDYQLEDTLFLPFTTRAFATGIPTTLVSGAIDIYEDATAAPIITGETLAVSLNSVAGFNMITVTATAATGFGAGQSYTAILQAGTVDSVSVVGEVVAHFTLDMSSAAKDLANATDGLGALRTLSLDIPTVSEFNARTLIAASYFDPAVDTVATVTAVTNAVGITAGAVDLIWDETMAGHTTADTAGLVMNDWQNAGRLDLILDIIAADVVNIDGSSMRGTDSAALASVCTEVRLAELAVANLPTDIDAILVDTGSLNDTKIPNTLNTTALGNIGIDWANVENKTSVVDLSATDIQLVDTATTVTNEVTADVTKISGSATAADNLEAHALETLSVTFSAGGSTTTAVLNLVDAAAAQATDDVYNGRILVFNNSTLDHQVTEITNYVGSTLTATITAVTTAPTATHTARMI